MISKKDLYKLMWNAIQASLKAGEAILRVYETDFSVSNKADNSPLTRADMEAHSLITDVLKDTEIPLLSEEGKDIEYLERKDWKLFWLVDPLDGTKEFVKRNGEFTVNIALIEDGFPLGGVIYVPVTDELYIGIGDSGAWKFTAVKHIIAKKSSLDSFLANGSKLPESILSEQYIVVCSRSHMSNETESFIAELKETHGELDFISKGSSLKLCMVAEGRADIYPRFAPTMEWDTAAGQAIVEAAGGTVVEADNGDRLRYNKEDLLNPWFIVKS
ncbi:MAG: 3'(2'),5'-bisphosphate nucleotidase CysQ [Bacteroidetes bacterium]|nr:3'(2'),5'-bisphosphate nucleotidase CysQ [Bacteroidota bacterium]